MTNSTNPFSLTGRLLFLLMIVGVAACDSLQAAPDTEKGGRWALWGSEPDSNATVVGRVNGELRFQDIDRKYILYTPASYSEQKPSPLVVALHGGHGDADKAYDRTGFQGLSEKEGFIVVYPEAVGSYWNDGRETTASDVDDVAYINALIKHIEKQRNIDKGRVYVTGLSNGGMMTQRLACESPETFAAFASVIANMPVSLQSKCKPGAAVSLMMINGAADPLMPPSGGEIKKSRWMGVGGTVRSTQQTARFWADLNQCSDTPVTTQLPDTDPGDGTRISKTEYSGCRPGAMVVLLNVEGGGHTWPGSKSKPFLQRLSGKTSNDIKASDVIWAFFARHQKSR